MAKKTPPPSEEKVKEWKSQGLVKDPNTGKVLPGCVPEGLTPFTSESARELWKERRRKYQEAAAKHLGEAIAAMDPDVALTKQVNPNQMAYDAYGVLVGKMGEQVYASDIPRPDALKEIAYAIGARQDRSDVSEEAPRVSQTDVVVAEILLLAVRLAKGEVEEPIDAEFRTDTDGEGTIAETSG